MADNQKTLKAPVAFSGKGLHTGMESNMTVHPAPAGSGIVFRRTDLEGRPEIPALADYVTDTSRGTTIEKGGAKVCTIEHIMSALWTLGIDNAVVEIDAPETPIMDGSAKDFAAALSETGLEEQEAERQYYEVRETIEFDYPEKNASIVIYPDSKFSVSVHVDYHSRVVGNQYATFSEEEDYAKEIAPCRTFAFLHELEPLLAANLIKGGDLDNAIVVAEKEVSDAELERLARVFDKKRHPHHGRIRQQPAAPLHQRNSTTQTARRTGRPGTARHADKGAASWPTGRAISSIRRRHGHSSATSSATRTARRSSTTRRPNRSTTSTVFRRTLPHRPPFLLVDRIFHIDETSVAGIKNVTMNEPFFVGHFPEEPVMPGVLIIEAMAQCGGILALNSVPDPENYSTYFLRIDNVRFKNKVVPGDTLQFELKLTEPIRRGIVVMEAKAYVGGRLTTEASLMAQVAKKQGMTARKAAPSRRGKRAAFSTICKPVRRAPAVRPPLGGKRKETRPGK